MRSEFTQSLFQPLREKLPREKWQERMYFIYVDNNSFLQLTKGRFPACRKSDDRHHPMFIWSQGGPYIMACPCSTHYYKTTTDFYIKKGAVTSLGKIIGNDTFLVNKLLFPVPRNKRFEDLFYDSSNREQFNPICWGIIKRESILPAEGHKKIIGVAQ